MKFNKTLVVSFAYVIITKATDTHMYMEGLEEAKDESFKPRQMWHCRMAGLPMGQYPSGLLVHSRQPNSENSHIQ